MRFLLISVTALLLGGCASSITAWKGRPFGAHGLGPEDRNGNSPAQLYIMTAERRVAILVPKEGWSYRFCAESLPEAALAVDGESKIDIIVQPDQKGSISDKVDQTLTQTFTRTEKAEVLRQLGWQLCQAWAQGVLDDKSYKEELLGLVRNGSKILSETAKKPPAAP